MARYSIEVATTNPSTHPFNVKKNIVGIAKTIPKKMKRKIFKALLKNIKIPIFSGPKLEKNEKKFLNSFNDSSANNGEETEKIIPTKKEHKKRSIDIGK
jgi:hypothetical protein